MSDCDFLFDIAHARVSACYFKQDIFDYLKKLPLHRIREVHVIGVGSDSIIGLWDSHTILMDEDYTIIKYVLENSKPEIITIEYGGFSDQVYNPFEKRHFTILRNNINQLKIMINNIINIIKTQHF